jgi:hypothetical protein
MSEQIVKVTQSLDVAYSRIEDSTNMLTKASVLFMVIQVKCRFRELSAIHQSLYVDIKQYIEAYIDGVMDSGTDFGYDAINTDKIIKAVTAIDVEKQKIQLWKRAEGELLEHNLIDECNEIRTYYKKSVICDSFASHSLIGILKGIGYISVYNVWSVIITLLFVFIFNYIITLPLSEDENPMFIIEHEVYSDNIYWNHFLNYFANLLELTDKTFCKAGNFIGLVVLLVLKLFYVCFGGWNAVDIIQDKIALKNE